MWKCFNIQIIIIIIIYSLRSTHLFIQRWKQWSSFSWTFVLIRKIRNKFLLVNNMLMSRLRNQWLIVVTSLSEMWVWCDDFSPSLTWWKVKLGLKQTLPLPAPHVEAPWAHPPRGEQVIHDCTLRLLIIRKTQFNCCNLITCLRLDLDWRDVV